MIPICKPWLPGKEKEYVINAIDTNWISSSGDYIEKFEKKFAGFCGNKYGVSCSSGLGALHLVCSALGLKKCDEVIVPTFTMAASINAIIFTGAKPVLVDADKGSYCIDVKKIEERITKNTRAIMPVHIYGHPCDMEEIMKLAKKYNLYVIEDAAEGHGAEYKGRKVGSIGDVGCFSFYANKILTTGEGGMCTTNNKDIAVKIKRLRNHAFDLPRFIHNEIGFNYRLTNIQAAIGLAQVENANMLVEARRSIGMRYNKRLKGIKGLILPIEKSCVKNVYWMYGIVLTDEVKYSKEEVMQKLKDLGVETRSFFIPMHKQPAYINKVVENVPDCKGSFPISDKISQRGFYVPSFSNISDKEIEYICKSLEDILNSRRSHKEKN